LASVQTGAISVGAVGLADVRKPKMAADPDRRPATTKMVATTSARFIAAFRVSSSALGEG
jgi:hypothetical protein